MTYPTLPSGKSLQRLGAFPLDSKEVFESLAAAVEYAQNDPTAYPSQLVAVRNSTNEPHFYIVCEDRSLAPFGSRSGFSGQGGLEVIYDFAIGDTVRVEPEVRPDGWHPCDGTAFDTVLYKELHARYQSGFLPLITDDEEHYVTIVKMRETTKNEIPETGFLSYYGTLAEEERQAVLQLNILLDKIHRYEEYRSQTAKIFGFPLTAHATAAELLAVVTGLKNAMSAFLISKGISITGNMTLLDMFERIMEIDMTGFRLLFFQIRGPEGTMTLVPDGNNLLMEKGRNLAPGTILADWGYEGAIHSQSLSGPGVTGIDFSDRSKSISLSSNIDEQDYSWKLSVQPNYGSPPLERTVTLSRVLPCYYATSPSVQVSDERILAATRVITKKRDMTITYSSIEGTLFLAVPESWGLFTVIREQNGQDVSRDFEQTLRPLLLPNGTTENYLLYLFKLANKLQQFTIHYKTQY